ncbi:MAG: FdhF/YdeP family oxidoreductase [Solirubrobacterales bacterium]|nr:FdhF/YdeP family oxidoreductase [Solirubrobacterales bacterium]MCB1009468.1 FdhF/YdeP family oxidoreductase [Acidobacteriota bacterium]MCB8970553.1 FdhF/YdeP family oxidoreductase [Thermoleophilales bacterium]MCO5325714.1 FdhF/YdeP family oxidoreductase [Solirubrobacterales bacterium]
MLRRPVKRWTPSNWASWKPFGLGEQRPNNYREVFRTVWENRDNAAYAWRILHDGVCDGCALGTKGLHDWTIEGTHLCNVRLRLLRLNTMGPLDPAELSDVEPLRSLRGEELRRMGRLPVPMRRRHGEPGFTPVSWDEALDGVAERIGASSPDRLGFFLTSRGMSNESYYAAQKAARAIGTNSIDNAARICHSPSTFALKEAVGVAATTCSYSDWIGTDLIVFVGSNVANNQPVTTKYLHLAKKAGTKVAVVNPYREPGMERYWIPSNPESALFGTKIADRFFTLNTGGDLGFLTGAMKHLIEADLVNRPFIDAHTVGFEQLRERAEAASWDDLEAVAGTTRAEMADFAEMLGAARRGVLVWSMGITQHAFGEDNVRAVVNLGLARGWVGEEGTGLMPIRGHSGVQGGAEMGCYSTAFPGGAAINAENAAELGDRWGFEVPAEEGMVAPEMIDAAARGELDLLFASGGNFIDVLPDPDAVSETLGRIPTRVHMDIVASSQMLVDPPEGGEVLILPATTRYENPGGVTETTTERRVVLSPEIPGPRIGEARAEWEVFGDLAARVRPELADRVRFSGTPEIRQEIGSVVPRYAEIAELREGGDAFQYGGAHLPSGTAFPTADGKAHFALIDVPDPIAPDGRFAVSTRRGKQFNSMVQERKDSLNGALRESVLIAAADAERLGLGEGAAVTLRSETGELDGVLRFAPIAPGNLQVHWPEGNVLIGERRSPEAEIPDYNARVEVVPRGS